MTPPCEGERWWSAISVKLEVSYTFSIYLWLFIKARLCQVLILWPCSVIPSLGEILHSAISALLLPLNQSGRLALLSDRGRTLPRPWWRLREMYICRYWLISPVNIMQGSVVLMLRTDRGGVVLWERDQLQLLAELLDLIQVGIIRFSNVYFDLGSRDDWQEVRVVYIKRDHSLSFSAGSCPFLLL